jgi:pimeloyl-ACP methyl ester carboxylesterase
MKMSVAHVNGMSLYYEITGEGAPVIFSHEFAGDYRSWEQQVRFFSRRYQVITYNNRGYPPSDVPKDPEAYSQEVIVEDLHQLMLYLKISRAHIVGFSMGASVALNFGVKHPEMCLSLVVAGCGSGSTNREQFEQDTRRVVDLLEREGTEKVAEIYVKRPTRVQFRRKDPRGFQDFLKRFMEHDPLGSALTLGGVQMRRPTIFTLEGVLKELAVPTLLMVGDEDDPCIEPTLFMKRLIPRSGLVVVPQSGHTLNLEEPDLFNSLVSNFFTAVEAGKWTQRDRAENNLKKQ